MRSLVYVAAVSSACAFFVDSVDVDSVYGRLNAATTTFSKVTLDPRVYPQDKVACLDGSPYTFYFAPSKTNSTAWVTFINGGGWCYNELDCLGRSWTSLGSSKENPDKLEVNTAMLLEDCEINPTFCQYNKIVLPYCDGNSFSSNREGVVTVNNQALHFRGLGNLNAAFDYAFKHLGLISVTDFILSGCSAGGLATIRHADRVHRIIGSGAPRLRRFGALPISGFFHDSENLFGFRTYGEQMTYNAKMTESKLGLNDECVRDSGSRWTQCSFAIHTIPFTKAPIFLFDSFFDSWQTKCILGGVLPLNFPLQDDPRTNGNCSAITPNWPNCEKNPYDSCDPTETTGLRRFQYDWMYFFRDVMSGQARNGYFVHNSHTHCAASSAKSWVSMTIGGVSIRDAVATWWEGLAGTPKWVGRMCGKLFPEPC